MEHFEIGDLVDFARNNCDPKIRDLMNAHLAEGCQRCSEELAAWLQLAGFSMREAEYTPPHDLVRMVKAAVSGKLPKSFNARVQELAQLVFDSFRQPQPQGVRANLSGKRHLIYRHDSMMIELSLEPGTGVDESLLIGQVTDYKAPRAQSFAISVICSAKQIAETRTNSLGEFFVEFKRQPNTWINLSIDENKDVVIPISDPQSNPS